MEKGLSCVSNTGQTRENQRQGSAFLTPMPFFQTKWISKLMDYEKYWGEGLVLCNPLSLIFIGGWIIYRCGKDLGPSLDTLSGPQQNPVYVLFLSNLLIPGDNSVTFIGNVLYCCLTFSFKKAVFKLYFVYGLSAEDMNNRLFISPFKPPLLCLHFV